MVHTALTVSSTSDNTVIAIWDEHKKTRELFLRHIERARVDIGDLKEWMVAKLDPWNCAWVGVERTSASLQQIREMRRDDGLAVRELHPDTDKVTRAASAVERICGGMMWLSSSAKKVGGLICRLGIVLPLPAKTLMICSKKNSVYVYMTSRSYSVSLVTI